MSYVSYFHFFEELKQIIHDVELDFKAANYTGDKFDAEYNTFLHKLIGHCQKYKSDTFRPSSAAFISSYISEISESGAYPHKYRFEKLIDVTSEYLRKAV